MVWPEFFKRLELYYSSLLKERTLFCPIFQLNNYFEFYTKKNMYLVVGTVIFNIKCTINLEIYKSWIKKIYSC